MTPDKLKAWRDGMGWTQLRASTELGITQASYNAMERGRAEISRRTALACMALQYQFGSIAQDAARYQWLRDQHWKDNKRDAVVNQDRLDSMIDAQLQHDAKRVE